MVVLSCGVGPPLVSRSISPYAWNARLVSTTATNTRVGDNIGTVTSVNRRHGLAPSTYALSCSSRGMLCSPAVTTMKVKPRLAQMLDTATLVSAVPGSFNRPGRFITGNSELSQSM